MAEMNIGIPSHVVVLGWNTPIYRGLAHTVCTELDLQNNKLFSLYPVSETPWTGRYEGKGAAVLGCGGRDIHTPKPFFVCFAPRVPVSAGARWWGDQSHLAWEVSSLRQPAALGWKQVSCQSHVARRVSLNSRAWHREWLINSGRSRRITKHQFLQKKASQGTVSPLLKISLQGPFWRSSRSRWVPWTEEKISTCSAVRTPCVLSQWSQ